MQGPGGYGGYWTWVCGPGICPAGGDNPIGPVRGYLGAKAPVQQLPLPVLDLAPGDTVGNAMQWIKNNWMLAGAIALGAYFILK